LDAFRSPLLIETSCDSSKEGNWTPEVLPQVTRILALPDDLIRQSIGNRNDSHHSRYQLLSVEVHIPAKVTSTTITAATRRALPMIKSWSRHWTLTLVYNRKEDNTNTTDTNTIATTAADSTEDEIHDNS
jgi:hypothetical protein